MNRITKATIGTVSYLAALFISLPLVYNSLLNNAIQMNDKKVSVKKEYVKEFEKEYQDNKLSAECKSQNKPSCESQLEGELSSLREEYKRNIDGYVTDGDGCGYSYNVIRYYTPVEKALHLDVDY